MKKQRSIYIHVPFCKNKCSYCNFASIRHNPQLAEMFVAQILKEIDSKKEILKNTAVISVYIGGGTPSILSGGQIAQIINELKKWTDFHNCEFTIEVNPESVEDEKLLVYKMLGVNRISIGMQSSSDLVLKASGRVHTNSQFLEAYKKVLNCGIKNINVDCIVGLPRSQKADTLQTIRQATSLKPKHISCYGLTCENGTKLFEGVKTGKIKLMNEDAFATSLEMAYSNLKKAGFKRYEISNFAKRGFECIHNKNYWQQGEYVGFGCGAVSFVNGQRMFCSGSVEDYCEGKIKFKTEKLTQEDLKKEKIMLSLRTSKGIELKEIESKKSIIKSLLKNRLAKIKNRHLVLTSKGLIISNEIILKLF